MLIMEALSSSVKRHTIMLVDDEESILNSLRRLLRVKPYDLLLATGPRRWNSLNSALST